MNLNSDPEPTPESRRRQADRSQKWRRASYVRDLWTDKQKAEEAERLEIEIAAFKVQKCKSPLWGGWYNRMPDVKHPEFGFLA